MKSLVLVFTALITAMLTTTILASPEAIVFVSFSMPDLSLKQAIHDARHYQVPIVMRGLHENSFPKTAAKIMELIKEDNKGGILINPVWFRKYKIKMVPAVVVTNKDQKDKFDLVYGNIPLARALNLIAEQGEAAVTAKKILLSSSLQAQRSNPEKSYWITTPQKNAARDDGFKDIGE